MTGLLVVAIEASADAHGASVLRELRSLVPDLSAFGAGGPRLREEGCETLVRAEDLSVMGVVDVIPAIPRLWRSLGMLRRVAAERTPRAALLIDSPDFNLRLAKRLRPLGIPVVYFIGPSVWAWRRYRIRQIARDVLRMLVILPFEAAFYERSGVNATYVGNPVADAVRSTAAAPAREDLRRTLGLDEGRPVLALLPGSRRGEIERIFPRMVEAATVLRGQVEGLQLVVPVAPTISREELAAKAPRDAVFVAGRAFDVLRACDAAIVTSGTATLEAALAGAPAVVVYRTSWINWLLGRLLVRVKHLALPNLLAGRAVMPELLQSRCTPERIAESAAPLLDSRSAERSRQIEGLRAVRDELAPSGSLGAARRAAEEIARVLGKAG
ncbi:MAG: lipid-A-disaccharide synthase [Deltaproteobacteria bacterium]|nr:MAG: lipid-A-disaccharide synthase [Deltaproteobacteria bacterium]TMB33688.1 MAG: lipid-A-disaccharide synthase [Deltaproteobacteria bacterium]